MKALNMLLFAAVVLAAPTQAQTYLISIEGTGFAPASPNPITEVAALGGATVRAIFQFDSSMATFTPSAPPGGQGEAARWSGAMQGALVTIGNDVVLARTLNDPGNLILVNNGGIVGNATARNDQVSYSASTGITPFGPLRAFEVFGLSPDIYLQSFFFGRTSLGTVDNLPMLVTSVAQRPDFPALLTAPVGNPPFLAMMFRQGNPLTIAAQNALPMQQLSVGNLRIEVVRLGAVPEPASWAMLIAGFGLVGAALRRRKRPLAA